MRVVHLADVHLGFRQYQRQTPNGLNQREADVAGAFKRAISKIIELRPDIVLIAGDVFHNVRPSNPAILHAFLEFSRLVQALPETDVVMVAGNHDTPRTTETGCILRLFIQLGIHVVDSVVRRIPLRNDEVQVLAVPDGLPSERPELIPIPGAHYNILLIHGEVEGILPAYALSADRAATAIKKSDLHAESWDYIALGHYHVYHPVGQNAYYSGSLEYTSSNFWSELGDQNRTEVRGKGFIEHDLDTGEHRFHSVESGRTLLDMPAIEGADMSAEQLNAAIRLAVESCDGGIAEKIVRIIVRDVPRHILRELDHKSLREFKRQALHFQLDARRPDVLRTREKGAGAPGRRPSLADTVRDHLRARAITPGVDRAQLVELGLKYLSEADIALPSAVGEVA